MFIKKTKSGNKTKTSQGFTLLEAMVVLFIIGLLSLTVAIGYGKASRQKMIEQSSGKISAELTAARDYSVFGQKIGESYPCGYGVAIGKDKNKIEGIYTSGDNMDRVGAADQNKTCDELIDKQQIALSAMPTDDQKSLSLEKASVARIDQVNSNIISDPDLGCLVVLFSAPRGMVYYCSGSGSSCPPNSCTFNVLAENSSLGDYFLTTLFVKEGFSQTKGYVKTYPSGNSEFLAE